MGRVLTGRPRTEYPLLGASGTGDGARLLVRRVRSAADPGTAGQVYLP